MPSFEDMSVCLNNNNLKDTAIFEKSLENTQMHT